MNYLIVKDGLTPQSEKYSVSGDLVSQFLLHRSVLVAALEMEIIFDQVTEAHWDFKNKVDYWKVRAISNPDADYVFNHEIRSSLNRLAFNLLNLSKLFLDKHFLKKSNESHVIRITGSTELHNEVAQQRAKIFEESLFYLIGCKLRNLSQHSKLPVQSFSTGMRYSHHSGERHVGFYIKFTYKDLVNLDIPKDRLDESAILDLTEIMDGYVHAITLMQHLNRTLILDAISRSKQFIEGIGSDVPSAQKFDEYYLELESEHGYIYQVSLEWFDVFHYLNRKHHTPVDYNSFKFEK